MTSTATAPPPAAAEASRESAPATPRSRFAAWLRMAWPVVVLIAIPTIVFGGSYAFGGHLLLVGDNLIQNFPLRELVGRDISHGIAPTWDPWIWSGTPLLAGENASALYPTTLLFAVFSPGAAWVTGEILMTSSVSVGTYLFFRLCGVSRLAGFLGAFSFAFAGAVASQSAVHIDMAEGFASLPWMLIAVREILDDGRWRWAWLLGLSGALLVLSGSPEALLDVGILTLAYGALRLVVKPRAWIRLATRGAVAGAFAVGSSAVVWMPALAFIATSQRANLPTSFAASYSFPQQAFILALVPYFEGGSRLFSQPVYFGESNLPEVALYVGILPLVAVGAMLSPRWRRRLPAGEARTWFCVAAFGILLAVGDSTPLIHVISHIPLYGRQRDQGRNIVAADFAACALLAWWIDASLKARGSASGSASASASGSAAAAASGSAAAAASGSAAAAASGSAAAAASGSAAAARSVPRSGSAVDTRLPRLRTRTETWTLCALLAVTVAAAVAFALSPTWIWARLHDAPQVASADGSVEGATIVALLLVLGAAAVVVLRDRLQVSSWRVLLTGFVIADIALFATGSSLLFSESPPTSANPGPVLRMVAKDLTPGGRYAVFDNDLYYYPALVTAGDPDIGILTGDPSVEGYGSIVNSVYAQQTGTHEQGYLFPNAIANGQLSEVDLEVVVAPPEAFLLPIGSLPARVEDITPLAEQAGVDPVLPGGNVPLPQVGLPPLVPAGPRGPTPSGGEKSWFFGTTLNTASAELVLTEPADNQLVRVGIVTPNGTLDWLGSRRLGHFTAASLELTGTPAEGVVIQLLSGPPLSESQLVVRAGARLYLDDGPLAKSVTPASYGETGAALHLAVFKSRTVPPTVWAQALSSQDDSNPSSPVPATITVASSTAAGATIEIDAPQPAILTRGVAYDPGWNATIVSGSSVVVKAAARAVATGSSLPGGRALAVHRIDLVQGVDVPAGYSLVRFAYSAKGLATGEKVSALTLAVSALGIIGLVTARRRRHRG